MEAKIFTRKVWDPEKGEYIVELEDIGKTLVETPCGQRRALLIRVGEEPYVWLIDHNEASGKEVDAGIEELLKKKLKFRVGVCGEKEKTYKLRGTGNSVQLVTVSFAVCLSDGDVDRYCILNSEVIPIGGDT